MMPTFIVAGPGRSGTTSVYYYLRQHPEVFMSRIKETDFFTYLAAQERSLVRGARMQFPVRSLDQYHELFRSAGGALARGEISPTYFWMPGVPRLIHTHIPDVRLLFILRNPLERAYSTFLKQRAYRVEDRTFEAAVEEELSQPRVTPLSASNYYVRMSLYAENLERFLEYIPSSQLKVLFFEDLKTKPTTFMGSIFKFIGVREDQEIDTSVQFNSGGTVRVDSVLRALGLKTVSRALHRSSPRLHHLIYRHFTRLVERPGGPPELSPETRGRLLALFASDIMRLQVMTGRELSHWRAD